MQPPEAFKTALHTVVNAHTPSAYPLPLTSALGKRRLFRKRAWSSRASDTLTRVTFMPDWMIRTPGGSHALMQSVLLDTANLPAELARIEQEYTVHLWAAPISAPVTWPRGNWAGAGGLNGGANPKEPTERFIPFPERRGWKGA